MTTIRYVRLFWATLLSVLSLAIALLSWRFLIGGVEATMAHMLYHAELRPIAFYAHVVLAPLALALVPFQLWEGLRRRRPAVHRLLGRIYGIAILASGTGGLILAATTESGALAGLGFGVLAVVWIGTTARGIALAMAGNIAGHRRWMIRSTALTLAAVTLRLQLAGAAITGLPDEAAYTAIAWLCWVPNLLAAEWYLRRPRMAQRSVA